MVICLEVRRFRCLSRRCPKVTFAEQVGGLTSPHARRTPALTAVLEAVALALGGWAGARLSGRLAAGVSRMTLLRLVRAMPDPAVSASPRILGVDDFALRRGLVHATVLIDAETGRRVDVVPAGPPAQPRDGCATIPEPRSCAVTGPGVYGEAARRALPSAVQVSDRRHLWHLLAEAAR